MPIYKDEKRGTFYVSVCYKDWTGKQTRKLKRGFATKREALQWERAFCLKESDSLDMTFGDFYKVYEKDVKPKIKHNTWITKDTVVQNKILPYFQNRKMNEITMRDIIQWQNAMIGLRNSKGEPYSGTYLRTCQSQLSAIFNHAVRYYELKSNPVTKAGPLGDGKADEMLFWTKEEYLAFITCVANKSNSFYAFEMLYWCGIRLGELLALTPADFDFEKNEVRITKSFQRIGGQDYITPPKTKKSNRVVTMNASLSMEMQDYIDSFYGIRETDRIFQISKSFLHHEMDRGVKDSGVKRIRIHDLRHSHVSLLINMGYSAVEIGNRVGHESADITFRYAHMFPGVQLSMAKDLDEQWKEGFDVSEEC